MEVLYYYLLLQHSNIVLLSTQGALPWYISYRSICLATLTVFKVTDWCHWLFSLQVWFLYEIWRVDKGLEFIIIIEVSTTLSLVGLWICDLDPFSRLFDSFPYFQAVSWGKYILGLKIKYVSSRLCEWLVLGRLSRNN